MTKGTFVDEQQVLHPSHQKFKVGTRFSVIALSVIFCLIGSILLTFTKDTYTFASATNGLSTSPVQTTPKARVSPTVTPSPTATPSPTPTPIPPTATPTPTPFVPQSHPEPVASFPYYQYQQVATLQAHDRFFYHGNTGLPEIALTFDDGPNPPYTSQILDILKQSNVKASFFDMGAHVAEHPELAQREFTEGHVVGNHTWLHPNLNLLSAADIQYQLALTSDTIQRAIGTRPIFFRPPYGNFDAHVLPVVNQQGLTTFIWNVDPQDWSMPPVASIIANVVGNARNGSIILMHDGGGDRSRTVAALPVIIDQLHARGFQFVTLKQLVDEVHIDPSAPPTPTATATPTPPKVLTPQEKWAEQRLRHLRRAQDD